MAVSQEMMAPDEFSSPIGEEYKRATKELDLHNLVSQSEDSEVYLRDFTSMFEEREGEGEQAEGKPSPSPMPASPEGAREPQSLGKNIEGVMEREGIKKQAKKEAEGSDTSGLLGMRREEERLKKVREEIRAQAEVDKVKYAPSVTEGVGGALKATALMVPQLASSFAFGVYQSVRGLYELSNALENFGGGRGFGTEDDSRFDVLKTGAMDFSWENDYFIFDSQIGFRSKWLDRNTEAHPLGKGLLEGMAQFMGGWYGVGKYSKLGGSALKGAAKRGSTTAGKLAEKTAKAGTEPRWMGLLSVEGATRGALVDYQSFHENDGNLMNLVEQMGIENEFTRFMSVDEKDSPEWNRARNAILGVAFESALSAFSKGKAKARTKDGAPFQRPDATRPSDVGPTDGGIVVGDGTTSGGPAEAFVDLFIKHIDAKWAVNKMELESSTLKSAEEAGLKTSDIVKKVQEMNQSVADGNVKGFHDSLNASIESGLLTPVEGRAFKLILKNYAKTRLLNLSETMSDLFTAKTQERLQANKQRFDELRRKADRTPIEDAELKMYQDELDASSASHDFLGSSEKDMRRIVDEQDLGPEGQGMVDDIVEWRKVGETTTATPDDIRKAGDVEALAGKKKVLTEAEQKILTEREKQKALKVQMDEFRARKAERTTEAREAQLKKAEKDEARLKETEADRKKLEELKKEKDALIPEKIRLQAESLAKQTEAVKKRIADAEAKKAKEKELAPLKAEQARLKAASDALVPEDLRVRVKALEKRLEAKRQRIEKQDRINKQNEKLEDVHALRAEAEDKLLELRPRRERLLAERKWLQEQKARKRLEAGEAKLEEDKVQFKQEQIDKIDKEIKAEEAKVKKSKKAEAEEVEVLDEESRLNDVEAELRASEAETAKLEEQRVATEAEVVAEAKKIEEDDLAFFKKKEAGREKLYKEFESEEGRLDEADKDLLNEILDSADPTEIDKISLQSLRQYVKTYYEARYAWVTALENYVKSPSQTTRGAMLLANKKLSAVRADAGYKLKSIDFIGRDDGFDFTHRRAHASKIGSEQIDDLINRREQGLLTDAEFDGLFKRVASEEIVALEKVRKMELESRAFDDMANNDGVIPDVHGLVRGVRNSERLSRLRETQGGFIDPKLLGAGVVNDLTRQKLKRVRSKFKEANENFKAIRLKIEAREKGQKLAEGDEPSLSKAAQYMRDKERYNFYRSSILLKINHHKKYAKIYSDSLSRNISDEYAKKDFKKHNEQVKFYEGELKKLEKSELSPDSPQFKKLFYEVGLELKDHPLYPFSHPDPEVANYNQRLVDAFGDAIRHAEYKKLRSEEEALWSAKKPLSLESLIKERGKRSKKDGQRGAVSLDFLTAGGALNLGKVKSFVTDLFDNGKGREATEDMIQERLILSSRFMDDLKNSDRATQDQMINRLAEAERNIKDARSLENKNILKDFYLTNLISNPKSSGMAVVYSLFHRSIIQNLAESGLVHSMNRGIRNVESSLTRDSNIKTELDIQNNINRRRRQSIVNAKMGQMKWYSTATKVWWRSYTTGKKPSKEITGVDVNELFSSKFNTVDEGDADDALLTMFDKYKSIPAENGAQSILGYIKNASLKLYDKTAGQGRALIQSLDMGLTTAQAQQVIARDAHFKTLTEQKNLGREFSDVEYKQRVQYHIENPSPDTLKNAKEEIQDVTLTAPMQGKWGKLGTFLTGLGDTKVAGLPVGLFATAATPFARVTLNSLTKFLQTDPITGTFNIAGKKVSGSFDELPVQQQNVLLAQLSIGVSLASAGYLLASQGRLTERGILVSDGEGGSREVSYDLLGPFAYNLRSSLLLHQTISRAEQYEAMGVHPDEWRNKLLASTAMLQGRNALSAGDLFGFFEGLGHILGDDPRSVDLAKKFAVKTGANLIPGSSLLRGVKKVEHPESPHWIDPLSDVKKVFPFYDDVFGDYPSKLNIFGNEVVDSSPHWTLRTVGAFTPFKVKGKGGEMEADLKKLFIDIGYDVQRTLSEIKTGDTEVKQIREIRPPSLYISIGDFLPPEDISKYSQISGGDLPPLKLKPQQYHDLMKLVSGKEATDLMGKQVSLSNSGYHPYAGTTMGEMSFEEAVHYQYKNDWPMLQSELMFPKRKKGDIPIQQIRYAIADMHQQFKSSGTTLFRDLYHVELQDDASRALREKARSLGF